MSDTPFQDLSWASTRSCFSVSLAAWATFQACVSRAIAEPGKWSCHQRSISRSIELAPRDREPAAPDSSAAIKSSCHVAGMHRCRSGAAAPSEAQNLNWNDRDRLVAEQAL